MYVLIKANQYWTRQCKRHCEMKKTSLSFSDSCKAYPIILGDDNVTRFSLPFVDSMVPGDPTWDQPHPDDEPPVWCFSESVASYIELNFTIPYNICAIETQGVQTSEDEMKYVSSYLIEVFEEISANCSEWKFYNGSGNITVSSFGILWLKRLLWYKEWEDFIKGSKPSFFVEWANHSAGHRSVMSSGYYRTQN